MIKFGTDGWRAVIGDQFTFENVEKVAQAYADILSADNPSVRHPKEGPLHGAVPPHPIPLGYDRRFLSEEFAKSFASVLSGNGIPVLISEGYCPTPCISWMTKSLKSPGGVMITASHNPFQWNGIKCKDGLGGSASPLFTSRIEKRVELNEREKRLPSKIPWNEALRRGLVRSFDPTGEYVAQLRSSIRLQGIQKAAWRIAYDPLFGSGAGFIGKVLEIPVQEIHQENNPAFGGLNPEPIEKNLFSLMTLVKKEKFDVGLATDGDADRIGAVDETGCFVNAHQIFALILNHLIERGQRGDVIKTVSTTRMIDRIAARHGLKVHETPIGFKHICSKFQEVPSLIGGEESGGIGIPSHLLERDGLFSGLLLLEIMSEKKRRLGELLKDLTREIGPFHFQREDVPLSPEEQEVARQRMEKNEPSRLGGLKVVEVNRTDGIKYLFEDESWLLLRLSGTEPLLRLYAEAPDANHVKKLIQEGRKLLKLS